MAQTVKNCKDSEIFPYLQINMLAWQSFINAAADIKHLSKRQSLATFQQQQ